MAQPEKNNQFVTSIVTAWNDNSIESIGRVLADDMILHGPRPDAPEGFSGNQFGKQSFLANLRQIRSALGEDACLIVQSVLSNDEYIAVRYLFSGQHVGFYLGVTPLGRSITLSVQDQYLLRDGVIAEVWHNPDRFSLIEEMTKAEDKLPNVEHNSAQLVASFPCGSFPESVVQHPNGDFYVTLMFDGQLVRVSASETQIIAQLPKEAMTGFLAGMATLNVDTSGRIIVDVLSDHPDYQGVWSYDAETGEGYRVAALPCLKNHLNGTAIDTAGNIYVADSTLGVIWQVKQGEDNGKVWARDPLLARRDYVGLAPGANGMRYFEGHLYVTVSDKGTVIKIPVQENGTAGVASVFATGVHGDDFAVDNDGTMYVTTHIHNSVVKVSSDGEVLATISDASDGIIGSTAAIISHDDEGNKWLYVTNDGGFLIPVGEGDPQPNLARILLAAA